MLLRQEQTRVYSEQGERREQRIQTSGGGGDRGITGGGTAAAPSYSVNAGAIKPSRGGEKSIESSHGYYGPYNNNCENQFEITYQTLHELEVLSGTSALPSSTSAFGLGSIGVSPKPTFSKSPNQISEEGLPMLIEGTSQEVYRNAYEPPFAFQFDSMSPAFVNGMQSLHQESQFQGIRYVHANGLPFPSSNHYLIAGVGNPVQFQQNQTQSVAAQMQYSVPSSQAQLLGDTLEQSSSLQPPALHPQQAMMLQGQSLRLQQPMLLHTKRNVPQHLNPISFQLPMQQVAHIAHPVCSRTSVTIGSMQPSQIPGTQFRPPIENQCIDPHLNKGIKITHPETHEELRFDSKFKKSESYKDTCMVSFPGSTIMPQRIAANHSPQSCSPVHSQAQNFHSGQERSYRLAFPPFYQFSHSSIPMGSLRVPDQNTTFSELSTQPLVCRASIGTPRISTLHGPAVPICLPTDNDRVQSVVPLPAEKNIIDSSSFSQVDNANLSTTTPVSCSGQLDSSKILPPGNCSSITESGLLSSLESETLALSCDIASSVVDSATDGIKQTIPYTAVPIRLAPAVDMASSDAPGSAPTGGPKLSDHGSQEGESVKTSSLTTMKHSKKSNKTKIQRMSSFASKREDPKEALVTSSAVHSSHSFVNNSPGNARPFVVQVTGNLNEAEPFSAEASTFSAERIALTSGHVNCCQVGDDKVVKESIEYLTPVDVVRISETSINLNEGIRNLKMEKTAEMVKLDNFSVNSIIGASGAPLVENHLIDAYESRSNASINLKDKPVDLTHSSKQKVESVSHMSNSQPSLGSGTKHTGSKKKKKKKNSVARADASSSTGDMYDLANAYKVPEVKNNYVNCPNKSNFAKFSVKSKHSDKSLKKFQIRMDDREGLTELPTSNYFMEKRLTKITKMVQVDVPKARNLECRKYTRDFLLKFKDQFRNLPSDYKIQADLAKHLFKISGFASHSYEPLNSRDHSEHLISNLGTDNRRIRSGGNISSAHDIPMEASPGWLGYGFRPRHSVKLSVIPSVPACIPGDPLGQMSIPLAGIPRNKYDVDKWQHSSVSFQNSFLPTCNNLPAIHKAKKKYEIGKVSDEENSKQRQIKAILNKLTPQNFDKLFYQVKEVNIDSAFTLTGVISQIFDKALMEPTFCEMYAKFCINLAAELPEFYDTNEKITFKRVLLNKCQEEFQRGERECEEADNIEEDVEVEQSNECREHKRIKARRRMLGNIRFIGELYKISMLSERIMHECIKKLLGEHDNPDEEDVEALCKLMSTIGHMIDQSEARKHIDVYFETMTKLGNNQKLPSRLRFMLKDVIDLRKNGWQQRTRVEGPKKIEEVHRDAVQQCQAHRACSKHDHTSDSSARNIHTLYDHASQKPTSIEFSSSQPIGSLQKIWEAKHHRGTPAYGGQDVRLEGRLALGRKSRHKISTHKPSEVPLTLGPQGGLSRGVINEEHPVPFEKNNTADAHQVIPVVNKQEDLGQMIGQSPNSFEQYLMPSVQERNSITRLSTNFRKQECNDDDSEVMQNNGNQLQDAVDKIPMAKHWLRERSDLAIKEYYRVRDMDEAALCVIDLKAAWFHSDMVSQWVIDSFNRKYVERDLLSKLLVHLHKTKPAILSCEQLIRGMAISLSFLKDSIIDAPRAPDFVGRILGKFVGQKILSFAECARIIQQGGIEPGASLKPGLALDMVTSVLNVVKLESGEVALTNMYKASKIQLKDFIPHDQNQHNLESLLKKKNLQCLYPVISGKRQ